MSDQPHDGAQWGGRQPPPGWPGQQPPPGWQGQQQAPQSQSPQPPLHSAPQPDPSLPPGWQLPPSHQGPHPGPGAVSSVGDPGARENVLLGLALSLLSIPIAMVTAVLISAIGFIAAITGLVLSGSALALYAKGAGAAPRRGVLPLIGVIAVGVVACVLSIIAWDVSAAYDQYGSAGVSKSSVIAQALVNPVIWKAEAGHVVMFVVFAALGMFGALRRIVAS